MDWTNYMFPFLSIFLALIQFSLSELSPEQCRDMGFSVNLLCSSCDELKPFNLTSEPSLEQNCRKCCHADGQDEATKRCNLLVMFGASGVMQLMHRRNLLGLLSFH